jgi:hypothetical protein
MPQLLPWKDMACLSPVGNGGTWSSAKSCAKFQVSFLSARFKGLANIGDGIFAD